jgi:hypothetical protein
MSYRQELQDLITELREQANGTNGLIDDAAREKRRRQAEVLDFLINHTQDALAALDA